jgi:hypothetical protein
LAKKSKEKQDLRTRIESRWGYYKARYAEYLDMARDVHLFYRGEQWTEEEKQILEAKGRPTTVKNRIAPRVELMTGYQRQNRYYFKVIASDLVGREEAEEVEAKAREYTAKLKQIEDEFQEAEFTVIEDDDEQLLLPSGQVE